jgi:IS1 family transposase/transposase-like protein
MIVSACQHEETKKHGRDTKGNQRLRCKACGQTWIEKQDTGYGNLRITEKEAATVLGMLLEGMSVRSVERLTGFHRDTVCDLVLRVGENCERLMDSIRDVEAKDVQVDEIWSFVGMKEKTRQARGYSPEFGDSWTFLGIDRNTKLVLAYAIGERDQSTTTAFLRKLDRATAGRFQLSTDGLATYTNNVPFTFGERVDYAQLVKNYAASQSETRYSPATIINAEKKAVFGNPDWEKVCTSHIESFNQKYRMALRRFTRLTNAHSKSLTHHKAMQAIYLCYYNWCRKHDTLKQTPAQASGLVEKQWTIRDLLENAAEA